MSERICIISRQDLLPATHGAAVKIVRTAQSLSRLRSRVFIVTNDRLWYHEVVGGVLNRRRYPQALLSATNVPPFIKSFLQHLRVPSYWDGVLLILSRLGYPKDEHFLYQAMVDPDFWLRVLYVGWLEKIDIYQAEFPGYAVPAALASRLLGGQSSLVEHNVEYLRLRDTTDLPLRIVRRMARLERFCARAVDHVIAVSAPDRARIEALGVDAEKTVVIPHGVDLAEFDSASAAGPRQAGRDAIRARYGLRSDLPLLVFHGTLHYWPNTCAVKHIAEDLLPRLKDRDVRVQAMICGMNPPRYYAHPDIVFTDVVQDLASHLMAADIAVVPLDDGGGTRLKILEYFATGLPVVSSTKGAEGIPATPGLEIELADDMDRFADIVAALCVDRERAFALAQAGLEFVQDYDWDVVSASYLERYRSGRVRRPLSWRLTRSLARPGRPGRRDRGEVGELPMLNPVLAPDSGRGGTNRGNGAAVEEAMYPTAVRQGAAETMCPASKQVSDHIPVPIRPSKPLTMIMMICSGCNLRCRFCDLSANTGVMERSLAFRVLEEAARLGVRSVVFTGGEPFLHPHLWEMVRRANGLGLGTNITTNGTLIEQHLEEILDSEIGSVSVSVDGLEETHEALRRVEGCYARTWEGLRLLEQHGVPTQIYFVVTARNIRELVPVYEMARGHGFGFDFWPVNDGGELSLVQPADRDSYRDALKTLSSKETDIAARRSYYEAGLDYHTCSKSAFRCLGLIEQFGVNQDGDLLPCCVWSVTDLKVGNLRESNLSELWFSDTARARRRQIFTEGCWKRCFNHSLYEFEWATGLSFEVGHRETE